MKMCSLVLLDYPAVFIERDLQHRVVIGPDFVTPLGRAALKCPRSRPPIPSVVSRSATQEPLDLLRGHSSLHGSEVVDFQLDSQFKGDESADRRDQK